jgi:ankyrin repeat protein
MDLHSCCRIGDLSEVRRLISTGVDVNLTAKYGKIRSVTPLHVASQYGHVDIVKELLGWGADIDSRSIRGSKDSFGCTPLILALEHDKHEVVKELLKHGANIDERNVRLGMTLLHVACSRNNIGMVRILLEYCDPAIKDDFGNTALDYARSDEIKDLLARAIEYQNQAYIKEPDSE